MVCSLGQHPPPHQVTDHGPFSPRRNSRYWSFGQFPLSCVCSPSLPSASWLCLWAAVRVFKRLFSLPIPGQLVAPLLQSQSQLLQSQFPYWCHHIRGSCGSSSLPYENPWSASRTVVRRRGLSAALNCFSGGVRVPSNHSLQRRWSVVVWRGNVLGTREQQ